MTISTPTSTQIGLLAENLVINALIIASNGRFAPFRPVADDDGIDLLLYDKVTGRVLPLQVKARTKTLKKRGSSDRGNIVHFQVREVSLRNKGYTRLLAVLLDEGATAIESAWLIPLQELEHIATKRGDKFVIRPNRSDDSQDKFKKYHLASMHVLTTNLIREFERFDPTFRTMKVLR
jgi:hypothetical protein